MLLEMSGSGNFFFDEFNMFCFCVCSMEQSVGQTASVNHAAELDQILASYKVCVDLSIRLCQVAWVTNMLCTSFLLEVLKGDFLQAKRGK